MLLTILFFHLFALALARQDHGHSDENVYGVHVDRNRLVYGVVVHVLLGTLHNTLSVIEQEHAKQDEAAIDRDRVQTQAHTSRRREEH